MTKRVYIAGPMTGYPEHNYPAFEAAAKTLRDAGYDVVSPHEINPESTPYVEAMRNDVRELITCDSICLLDGWERSRGAFGEEYLARLLEFEVVNLAAVRAAVYPL